LKLIAEIKSGARYRPEDFLDILTAYLLFSTSLARLVAPP
jgi:hypothetical protein